MYIKEGLLEILEKKNIPKFFLGYQDDSETLHLVGFEPHEFDFGKNTSKVQTKKVKVTSLKMIDTCLKTIDQCIAAFIECLHHKG